MRRFSVFLLTLGILLVIGLPLTSIQSQEKNVDRVLYEIPNDCDFANISNIKQRNECTPRLLDNSFFPFIGILINGPSNVVWPQNATFEDYPPSPFGETSGPLRLMVAGLIKIKSPADDFDGGIGPEVLLVAVDQKSAETYCGKMETPESLPDSESRSPNMTTLEIDRNVPVASVFNVDLVHNLGLPIADATYTVYATFGDYKSNVLTIETRVE